MLPGPFNTTCILAYVHMGCSQTLPRLMWMSKDTYNAVVVHEQKMVLVFCVKNNLVFPWTLPMLWHFQINNKHEFASRNTTYKSFCEYPCCRRECLWCCFWCWLYCFTVTVTCHWRVCECLWCCRCPQSGPAGLYYNHSSAGGNTFDVVDV